MNKHFFYFLALFVLVFSACKEEQSEFNLDDVEQTATVRGNVKYNAGADASSSDYRIEVYKAAEGRKVFLDVALKDYLVGSGTGDIKTYEAVIDADGNFEIQFPSVVNGVGVTLRLEEFVAPFQVFDKMEEGSPVFKSQLKRYTTPVTYLTSLGKLKPNETINEEDVKYKIDDFDLEGYDKSVNLTGTVFMAYESAYRTGEYRAAANQNVEIKVDYSASGLSEPVIFGATTDANGNIKTGMPVKSYKDGFIIQSLKILGSANDEFTHYNAEASVKLKGAYATKSAEGVTAYTTFSDLIEGVDVNFGKQYLPFTPNYNYSGLPSQNKPETWADNLAGWLVDKNTNLAKYTESVTITGSSKLPVESAYAVGTYGGGVHTIELTIQYAFPINTQTVLAATDANGNFSVSIPVEKTTSAYTLTLSNPYEKTTYEHYKTASEKIELTGNYSLRAKIEPDNKKWYQLGDNYYQFNPSASVETYSTDLAGWLKIKGYDKTALVSGKIYEAVESGYLTGTYAPAAGRRIGIAIPYGGSIGNQTLFVPVGTDGTYSVTIPIQNDGDEFTLTTANISPNYKTKDYRHYNAGGKNDTRILAGTYSLNTNIKSADAKWNELGDIYYRFTPDVLPTTFEQNLAGWVKKAGFNGSANVEGALKFATESGFRQGIYSNAAYQKVSITHESTIYVGATKADGTFSIPVLLKFNGMESNISSWGFPTLNVKNYEHYAIPGTDNKEILEGSYSGYLTDKPASASWNQLGTRYCKFYPTGSPVNWSDNLPGWLKVAGATKTVSIKGNVKKAYQKKDGGTWKASWTNDANRMATVTLNGIPYDVVSNSSGAFSFSLPVTTLPASYTVTVTPVNDVNNVSFIHHEDPSKDAQTTIYGKFTSAGNISNKTVSASGTNNDEFDITKASSPESSAKMTFNPISIPDGWSSYTWNTNNDD
ncbi:MAG: hypothetical protein LBS07_04660 [Prevotellaceae bacterium]|nr:hypothetical protein [Prevotellaceae bacterium]